MLREWRGEYDHYTLHKGLENQIMKILFLERPGMMVHACNPSTIE